MVPSLELIRPFLPNEKEIVFSLFKSIFDSSEVRYFELSWKERSPSSVGLFSPEGELRGFTLVIGNELKYIGVSNKYQGSGYGSRLLHEAVQRSLHGTIRSLYLIPVDNPKVIEWYKKRGFSLSSSKRLYSNIWRHILVYRDYNTRS
jgi:ribosomal protein S18 acetylase RimI-like enzyme